MVWVLQEYNKLSLGHRMMLESPANSNYPKFDKAAHGSQVEVTKFVLRKIELEDPILFISVDRSNKISYYQSSDPQVLGEHIVEIDHPDSFFSLTSCCGAEERARLSDTGSWDIAQALIDNDARLVNRSQEVERALVQFLSTLEHPTAANDQRLRVFLLQQLNLLRGVTMVECFLQQNEALGRDEDWQPHQYIQTNYSDCSSSNSISPPNSYVHCNDSRQFQPARRQRQVRIRQELNELVANEENCALYIKKIHPMASAQEILDVVKTGAIANYAYYGPNGRHRSAAAKIVFFKRQSAYDFLLQSNSLQGIDIRGLRVEASWNIGKVGPSKQNGSRVVQIFGPAHELSIDRLLDFYSTKFEFVLVHAKEWMRYDDMKVIELGFGSLKPQAEWACMSFSTFLCENGLNLDEFTIGYAADPCDLRAHSD